MNKRKSNPTSTIRPHYYVALGASAGGLEAIEAFFRSTPPDTGMAFVVLQHLSPDYPSMMVELLSKQTRMPVIRAEENMEVAADTVYLLPPKKNMALKEGKLVLTDQDRHRGLVNLPIDFFLESLASDQGEQGIAIILSGTGSDGTQGIKAVKASGGLVIAQSPDSAKFDGMPRSVADTGLADYVLPPQDIASQLLAFSRHPYAQIEERESDEALAPEEELDAVFTMLADHYKVDFRFYKPNTLNRRIRRRIQVHQLDSLGAYLTYLQNTPEELSALYQELLIGVTSFFRDEPAWDYLSEEVMPELIQKAGKGGLRLWSVGCSTGEEAYSLAIMALEACERLGRPLDVKVFATDVDGEAILTAGKGAYPAALLSNMPVALRNKYFTQQDNVCTVKRHLRECVVFARQNVLSDPPFTNIDLLSCRNLLIYFEPVLQKKAMSVFGFALHAGGVLFLGKSESPGPAQRDYDVVDARFKLYRLLTRRMMMTGSVDQGEMVSPREVQPNQRPSDYSRSESVMERLLTALTGNYLPLVVVINEAGQLIHLSGETNGLFRLAEGRPTTDITRLAHPDLAMPFSTGVHKVFREHEAVSYTNLRIKNGQSVDVYNVHLLPLPGQRRGQSGLVAAVIERAEKPSKSAIEATATFDLDTATEARITDLENELQVTRENLQAAVEELETSNEELQATNEELLSSNEELQSTNEELQSVNEELHTINAEVVSKNNELVQLSNDVQDLLGSSESYLLLLDAELNVRQFTPTLTKVFSLEEKDVGRPVAYARHNLMLPELMQVLEDVAKNGTRHEQDVNDNQGNSYILRVLPTTGAGQNPKADQPQRRGVVLGLVNINERIASEKALRENEARFQLMVNALPGFVIHMLDPKGYVLTWNDSAQATTGFERREVLGRKYAMFFEQADIAAGVPEKLLQDALDHGKSEDAGWRVRKDGSRFWASSVISPLRGADDELLGFVCIAQDKTNLQASEQLLRKFSQAINQSKELMLLADAEGVVEHVNQSYLDVTGVNLLDIKGVGLAEVLAPLLAEPAQQSLQQAIEAAAEWTGMLQRATVDGEIRFYRATLSPLKDGQDQPNGYLLRQEDVTESQRLIETQQIHARELERRVADRTRDFEKARDQAEKLAQVKSDFLSHMSHEIRTPMNAVLGLAYVLGKMELPPEAADMVRKIHNSGESLMGLLNDILDFSKLEAGKVKLEHAPFYLGDVLDNLATIMAASAKGKGLDLAIAAPPTEACYLVGDSLRLGQVLINLTSNAIKFTSEGQVDVRIELLEQAGDKVKLRFMVSDSGIGMDAATQERLFSAFTQADESTTRRFGGTGLGLVISQRLVENMGGQITLESAPNQGSTFSFTLTLDQQANVAEQMQQSIDLRVLVADDNAFSLTALGATLRSIGWEPELFDSGAAILQRVLDEPALQNPQTVLLLDWKMPGMSGLEVAHALHQRLPGNARPVMVLITAHGADQLQHASEFDRVDELIAKPVGPSLLYNAVMNARAHRLGNPKLRNAPQTQHRLQGLKLLVVDDSSLNLDVACRIFEDEGAEVHTAGDGQQALDWVRSHPDALDAVLMDVHMPVMDGLEATRQIRQLPGCADLPIFALTAGALHEQREAAQEAGMSGFIAKPFVVDQAIAQLLAATRPQEAARNPGAFSPAPLAATPKDALLLNAERGLRLFRKPGTFAESLRKFLHQYQAQLDDLAQMDQNPKALKQLAHKLRGNAGNLGLERVAATAAQLEACARDGCDPDTSQALTRTLSDDLQQTFEAIEAYLASLPAHHAKATGNVASSSGSRRQASPEVLAPLFNRALDALDEFNPKPVELALTELKHYLDKTQLRSVAEPLAACDFKQTGQALRELARAFNVPLKDNP